MSRLVGIFAASGVLFVLAMLYKGGMGGGDIKLMAAAGFLLGWRNVLIALMLGAVVGTLWLAVTRTLKKSDMKKEVPFGPHLAIGILLSMYFANPLMQWYVGIWS